MMKLAGKQGMTAAELVATRERMGWDRARLADELGLLQAEVAAMESGSLPISAQTAEYVRIAVVDEERRALLEASGLPACPRADALDAVVVAAYERGDPDAGLQAMDALVAHHQECGVCRARGEYLDAHGPPDARPRLPWWMWPFHLASILGDRLPAPLRPPPGVRGEHRRTGVFIGAYLTSFATLLIASFALVELVTGRTGQEPALEMALALPVLAIAYVVGGYLAGAAWDATRGIRHRLMGYVVRGAATAAAMYGAMGLVMPFIDVEPLSAGEFLAILAFLAGFGGLAGAGKWIRDRRADDLPDPVTDPGKGPAPRP